MHDYSQHHIQFDLHHAATTGNVGLVKFALDHGATIDGIVNGFMPLQLACVSDNNLAAVQYLIDRGAQVDAQSWSTKRDTEATGSTALHVACANGCIRIVDLLLRNGASTHVKDKYGSTPHDVALAKHHMDIVRLLDRLPILTDPLRLDKPLPIPIRPSPLPHTTTTSSAPDLAHTASSSRSSSGCSDELPDWYAVGIVANKQQDECYLHSLERRLSGSFDSGFLRSSCIMDHHHYLPPIPSSSPPPPPLPPKDDFYTTQQHRKPSLSSSNFILHPSSALALTLESLDRVSRKVMDIRKNNSGNATRLQEQNIKESRSFYSRMARSWKKFSKWAR
ncbi:ankyrin [Lichtheimia hyalospora FSU 10163]|nr:ankyrin [Lichtheimia hyalospora FSU 10163]